MDGIIIHLNPTYRRNVFVHVTFGLKSDKSFTKSDRVFVHVTFGLKSYPTFSKGDGLYNTYSGKCVLKVILDIMQYDSDM